MAYLPLLKHELVTAINDSSTSPSAGILTIMVHSAKELSVQKQSSLRCEVSIGNVAFPPNGPDWLVGSTPSLKKTNTPAWDSTIQFYVMNTKTATFKFTVKDSSKSLGEVDLQMKDVLDAMNNKNPDSDWFKLSTPTGRLRISFAFKSIDPAYLSNDNSSTSGREPKFVMKIKVAKAKALVNVELLGRKSDPYAKIKVGTTAVGATRVKENTLDPVWNETFYSVVYSRKQKVIIELWDYNNVKLDKSLGNVELALEDLFSFHDDQVEKGKEFLQLKNDGLKIEQVGTNLKVTAPIYLKKIEEEQVDNEKLAETPDDAKPRNFTLLRHGDAIIDTLAASAKLQRGFLYFELEYYRVKDQSEHITALDKEDYDFIARQRGAVVKEIHRLRTLEEVHVLTHEDAEERIAAISAKGHIGDIEESKAKLLSLPAARDIVAKYDSGILRFHIYGINSMSTPVNAYIEIKMDEEICFSTRIQEHSTNPKWNVSADVCIRSYSGQKTSILLRDAKDADKKGADDRIVATWESDLLELLGKRKHRLQLQSTSLQQQDAVELVVSLNYFPIDTCLADSTRSTGMLYIDIKTATNLDAVDHSGTSDPYCIIYLNDDILHKTQVHKKNLNPIFNESIHCSIQSRLKSTLNFVIKDHNSIGKHVTLGTIEFNLSDLKSKELLNLTMPLSGARDGQLSFGLFFDHTAHVLKRNESERGFDATSNRLENGLGLETVGIFNAIGKHILGAPKQSQENTVTAEEIAMKLGIVLLTIERAEDLKAVDDNGEADPYVKVEQLLHGKVNTLFKTKSIKKNRSPIWNEAIQFKVPPSTITLVIKDKNLFGHSKPLGEVELDLAILFSQAIVFEEWFPIGLGGQGRILVKGQFQKDDGGSALKDIPRWPSSSSITSIPSHLEQEHGKPVSKLGFFHKRERKESDLKRT
ncbi:hypothetical protein HDU98_007810 [Podochytrium sp. JEL0797]|nr:hypothetical protein HDU98_007810 [Podochytrium sp. JEL0797]